jgi:hypothetical protein
MVEICKNKSKNGPIEKSVRQVGNLSLDRFVCGASAAVA